MAITKVTNSLVSVNAIHGTLIADNAITSVHIAQNQVTAVQIPDGSITSTQLGANSVDSSELVDGSIDTSHLSSNVVTEPKIANNSVRTAAIAQNQITSKHIADGSITDTQLGSGAFTMGTITTTGQIRGPASLTLDPATVGDNTGTVVIAGNLQVDGTTTTINSTTLNSADKNITLGFGGSASANNGGGITIAGATATLLYNHSDTSWQFNKPTRVISSEFSVSSGAGYTTHFNYENGGNNIISQANGASTAIRNSAKTLFTVAPAGDVTIADGIFTSIHDITTLNKFKTTNNNTRAALSLESKDSSGNAVDLRMHALGDGPRGEIFTHSNHPLAFSTNNAAPQMTLLTNGNFGIGATSPSGKLHVRVTDTTGDIRIGGGNGANNHRVFISAHATAAYIDSYGGSAYNNLGIQASTLHLNSASGTGSVGIGTASPAAKLHVNGTGTDGQEVFRITSNGDVADNGYHWMSSSIAGSQSTNASMVHLIGVAENTRNSGYFGFHYTGAGSTDNYLKFGGYAADNLMVIKMNGNVGIGELSPANLLHVKASDTGIAPHSSAQIVLEREGTNYLQFLTAEAGTSGILFGDGSDVDVSKISVDHNTTKMTFTNETVDTMTLNGAKVGIGIAAPGYPLEISSAATVSFAYQRTGHSCKKWGFNSDNSNTYWMNLTDNVYGPTVSNAGKVGIGTIAPGNMLEVKASGGDQGIKLKSSSNADLIWLHQQSTSEGVLRIYGSGGAKVIIPGHNSPTYFNNGNNFGIGTAVPLAKLDTHLTQTSGTLTTSNYAHFGSQVHSNGGIMGITLGYREPNLNYRKVGIVAEGLGDNAARQDFHILVNTVDSAASVQKSDSKLMIDGINGNVGIGTTTPATKLHVNVPGSSDGYAVGGKNLSMTTAFQTGAQLEITLGDHQGCYVKVFVTGDWGSHSAMAFMGEYFIQNGANGYSEPGMIIREVDNTNTVDSLSSQIYDGGDVNSFQIQFKLNRTLGATSTAANLTYQVMGQFDSIT